MLHAGLDLCRRKAGGPARRSARLSLAEDTRAAHRRSSRRARLRRGRVNDPREARPRHARARGLVGRDSRCPEGQGTRSLGLQDRQDRFDGSGGALAPRPGAGDLAARSPIREERELARFRLHLVKHKSALKCRIHSTLINFARPCPVTDLFGAEGRRLLARLDVPSPGVAT
jgi:hypothetical protein